MNMKDLKRLGFCGLMATASLTGMAQSLEKMQWFNEPAQWEIDGNTLLMDVTPQTDYWRISHYGFTVDDAPFLYTLRGGEFEVKVKISGDYQTRFDQSGLMLRIDHENYIKAGIEFVDGKYNLSTVVTHHTSDWSIIPLDACAVRMDKGRAPAGCRRDILFLRRQGIHDDAQCLVAGQLSGHGRHHGGLPGRKWLQGTV